MPKKEKKKPHLDRFGDVVKTSRGAAGPAVPKDAKLKKGEKPPPSPSRVTAADRELLALQAEEVGPSPHAQIHSTTPQHCCRCCGLDDAAEP
jgi:hypothetical protein